DAARAWVLEQNEENLATARAYLAGESAFPQRAALNQLPGRFLIEFYVTVARLVDWASAIVEDWPDDVRSAAFNQAAAEEAVALSSARHLVRRVTTATALRGGLVLRDGPNERCPVTELLTQAGVAGGGYGAAGHGPADVGGRRP